MENICVVEIGVTDMDAAIDYYERLGFPAMGKKMYPDYVELEHADRDRFHFLLSKCKESVEDPYPHCSQTKINIETGDLVAKMAELRERGIEPMTNEPQPFPEGVFAAYKDPFGNVMEIVEFREPRRDQHRHKKSGNPKSKK